MPTYEFRCAQCDETFEVFYRSFAESERVLDGKSRKIACARCGARAAERVFSVFGARSKSSGGPSPSPAPGGPCCGGGGCGCG